MSTEHDTNDTINIDDDTQGHAIRFKGEPAKVETTDDDTEGHAMRFKPEPAKVEATDDDTV